MNNSNLTGETKVTGISFNEERVSANYVGADQLNGIEVAPGTPVAGYFLQTSEELGLFQPEGSTQIFEVVPEDINITEGLTAVASN